MINSVRIYGQRIRQLPHMGRESGSCHNKKYLEGKRRFIMDLNELATLTPEEYSVRLGAITSSEEGRRGRKPTSRLRLDYRTLGFVTPVKNQRQQCQHD
ncbi:hypothetical protein AALO_G00018690 [Alosa alosa]|uniref:Uncharacterized protein n=1 Tax=Alosa alosa TaxID=278164 RepID=A0AAV6HMN0_9TELE|nr:hypothetical protein AALO_G00018690 [Alosa alosa]